MEKKESIKEYLQKMLDRWNKYDVLDGFVAENFRVDLEKTLEYWDLRIADNKEELDKAREEVADEVAREIGYGKLSGEEHYKTLNRVIKLISKLKDNK